MSDDTVKQFVDFTGDVDTGIDAASAIAPYTDGEGGTAAVFNRPGELLRQRTELLKGIVEDLLHLRDADRGLIIGGPGKVTWPGSTTESETGTPILTDTLWLVPALTPGHPQSGAIPPVTSAYGTLILDRAGALDGISVLSRRRSYQGGDRISVEVVETDGALTAALVGDRSILVAAPASTTLSAVVTKLNDIDADDPATQLVTASLAGGATGSDLLVIPQAKQFISGNFDGEGHTITPGNLATFFATSANRLAEGDTLCIQYDKVIEPGSGTGGRRQSIPENTNTAVPVGSFFNSRLHPERLTNAIPLCKVIDDRLVFLTGQTVPAGGVDWDLGDPTVNVPPEGVASYNGGAAWADGTTNPGPVTVEAQLDKIIDDLTDDTADAGGAAKIAIGARTYPGAGALTASSLAARLLAMDTAYDGRMDTLASSIAGYAASIAALDSEKVDKAGDTMSGALDVAGLITARTGIEPGGAHADSIGDTVPFKHVKADAAVFNNIGGTQSDIVLSVLCDENQTVNMVQWNGVGVPSQGVGRFGRLLSRGYHLHDDFFYLNTNIWTAVNVGTDGFSAMAGASGSRRNQMRLSCGVAEDGFATIYGSDHTMLKMDGRSVGFRVRLELTGTPKNMTVGFTDHTTGQLDADYPTSFAAFKLTTGTLNLNYMSGFGLSSLAVALVAGHQTYLTLMCVGSGGGNATIYYTVSEAPDGGSGTRGVITGATAFSSEMRPFVSIQSDGTDRTCYLDSIEIWSDNKPV